MQASLSAGCWSPGKNFLVSIATHRQALAGSDGRKAEEKELRMEKMLSAVLCHGQRWI